MRIVNHDRQRTLIAQCLEDRIHTLFNGAITVEETSLNVTYLEVVGYEADEGREDS